MLWMRLCCFMHLLFRVYIFPGRSTMVFILYPTSSWIHIYMMFHWFLQFSLKYTFYLILWLIVGILLVKEFYYNDLRTLLRVNFLCRYIWRWWFDFTLPFNVISCCTKCFFYSERKSIPIDLWLKLSEYFPAFKFQLA